MTAGRYGEREAAGAGDVIDGVVVHVLTLCAAVGDVLRVITRVKPPKDRLLLSDTANNGDCESGLETCICRWRH